MGKSTAIPSSQSYEEDFESEATDASLASMEKAADGNDADVEAPVSGECSGSSGEQRSGERSECDAEPAQESPSQPAPVDTLEHSPVQHPAMCPTAVESPAGRGTFFGVDLSSPDCSPLRSRLETSSLPGPLPSKSPQISPQRHCQSGVLKPSQQPASPEDCLMEDALAAADAAPDAPDSRAAATAVSQDAGRAGQQAVQEEQSQLSAENSDSSRHLQQLHNEMQQLQNLHLELRHHQEQQLQQAATGSPGSLPNGAVQLAGLAADLGAQSAAGHSIQQEQSLAAQLKAALEAQERLQQAAEAARQEAATERSLRMQCEAKLQQKQQEILQLRTRVRALEQQGPKGKVLAESAELVMLSPEEAAQLRRDIQEQEVLLRAYQQENEAAVRRIKELQEEVAATRQAAVEDVQRAERQAMQVAEETRRQNQEAGGRLRRVLELESELAALREGAQQREGELRSQVERLRQEKRELEARQGGVDLRQMQEGDLLVARIRQEMEALKQRHDAVVSELRAKLAWYVENQELLDQNSGLIQEQAALIHKLERRLEAAGAAPGAPKAAQRVRELEQRVEQLQRALASRNPNSLAAVVQAAKPAPAQDGLVRSLSTQLEQLQQELRSKDEAYEAQLRGLQQQLERVKQQYADKVARAELGGKGRQRIKELERQIDDLRTAYSRRIRGLEAKLAASGGASRRASDTGRERDGSGGGAAAEGGKPAAGTLLRQKELDVCRLQQQLQSRDAHVAQLEAAIRQLQAHGSSPGERPAPPSAESSEGSQGQGIRQGQGISLRSGRMASSRSDAPPASAAAAGPAGEAEGGAGAGLVRASSSRSQALARLKRRSTDSSQAASQQQSQQQLHAACDAQQPLQEQRQQQLEALEAQCRQLSGDKQRLQSQLQEAQWLLSASGQLGSSSGHQLPDAFQPVATSAGAAHDAAGEELHRRLAAASLALETVQRAHTTAVEQCALLKSEHQRELLRTHEEARQQEAARWQDKVAALQAELDAARRRAQQLDSELARLRLRISWSPAAHDFAALEERLAELERVQAAEQAAAQEAATHAAEMHRTQLETMRRKAELAMEAKNAEIERFKMELQGLVYSVRLLKMQQQQQQQ